MGSEYLIGGLRDIQGMMGAICDPHVAYLLLRGVKTLDLRVERHNDTGMKVAQLVVKPVEQAEIESVDEIDANTERADGGYGSTGK